MNNDIEQESERRHIKRAGIMAVFGVIMVIIGFSFLVCAAIIQGNGHNVSEFVIMAGFFGCNIVGVIMIYKAYPYIVMSDYIRLGKKYDSLELSELDNMDKDSVSEKLLENGFTYTDEGYYTKKERSALRDNIYYYIRMVDGNEIENVVLKEVDYFNSVKKAKKTNSKEKNLCIILFVYMNDMREKDKKDIKEFGKNNIILETVKDPNVGTSIIAVGVDSVTYKGYFLDIDKANMVTIYSHGCKLIKHICVKNNVDT